MKSEFGIDGEFSPEFYKIEPSSSVFNFLLEMFHFVY